jgi:hypothetical protein
MEERCARNAGNARYSRFPGFPAKAQPRLQAHCGISFRRRSPANTFPAIAKFGPPEAAFVMNGGADDQLNVTNAGDCGQFFITDDPASGTCGDGIILDFDAPVSQVSGCIFDVDSDETVTVEAFSDSSGTNRLASQTFTKGMPNTGDGKVTGWSFSRPTSDIRRIDIALTGGGGVGFDNFASDYTPPPQTPATLGLKTYPGLTIQGDVGRPYRIDYTESLNGTNWIGLTTLFLPSSPYLFVDTNATTSAQRFYRAVAVP